MALKKVAKTAPKATRRSTRVAKKGTAAVAEVDETGVAPQKAVAKKVAPKRAAPKKAAPKKAALKKIAPKKAAPEEVAPEKVTSEVIPETAPKSTLKKAAPKKAAPKKAAPKKAAPKKAAPKKAATKPVGIRKAAPKKAAAKKTATKAAHKKAIVKGPSNEDAFVKAFIGASIPTKATAKKTTTKASLKRAAVKKNTTKSAQKKAFVEDIIDEEALDDDSSDEDFFVDPPTGKKAAVTRTSTKAAPKKAVRDESWGEQFFEPVPKKAAAKKATAKAVPKKAALKKAAAKKAATKAATEKVFDEESGGEQSFEPAPKKAATQKATKKAAPKKAAAKPVGVKKPATKAAARKAASKETETELDVEDFEGFEGADVAMPQEEGYHQSVLERALRRQCPRFAPYYRFVTHRTTGKFSFVSTEVDRSVHTIGPLPWHVDEPLFKLAVERAAFFNDTVYAEPRKTPRLTTGWTENHEQDHTNIANHVRNILAEIEIVPEDYTEYKVYDNGLLYKPRVPESLPILGPFSLRDGEDEIRSRMEKNFMVHRWELLRKIAFARRGIVDWREHYFRQPYHWKSGPLKDNSFVLLDLKYPHTIADLEDALDRALLYDQREQSVEDMLPSSALMELKNVKTMALISILALYGLEVTDYELNPSSDSIALTAKLAITPRLGRLVVNGRTAVNGILNTDGQICKRLGNELVDGPYPDDRPAMARIGGQSRQLALTILKACGIDLASNYIFEGSSPYYFFWRPTYNHPETPPLGPFYYGTGHVNIQRVYLQTIHSADGPSKSYDFYMSGRVPERYRDYRDTLLQEYYRNSLPMEGAEMEDRTSDGKLILEGELPDLGNKRRKRDPTTDTGFDLFGHHDRSEIVRLKAIYDQLLKATIGGDPPAKLLEVPGQLDGWTATDLELRQTGIASVVSNLCRHDDLQVAGKATILINIWKKEVFEEHKAIQRRGELLLHAARGNDPSRIPRRLAGLKGWSATGHILRETGIGELVNELRQHADPKVAEAAESLAMKWDADIEDLSRFTKKYPVPPAPVTKLTKKALTPIRATTFKFTKSTSPTSRSPPSPSTIRTTNHKIQPPARRGSARRAGLRTPQDIAFGLPSWGFFDTNRNTPPRSVPSYFSGYDRDQPQPTVIRHIAKQLSRDLKIGGRESSVYLEALDSLKDWIVSKRLLRNTGIGRIIEKLVFHRDHKVSFRARKMLLRWRYQLGVQSRTRDGERRSVETTAYPDIDMSSRPNDTLDWSLHLDSPSDDEGEALVVRRESLNRMKEVPGKDPMNVAWEKGKLVPKPNKPGQEPDGSDSSEASEILETSDESEDAAQDEEDGNSESSSESGIDEDDDEEKDEDDDSEESSSGDDPESGDDSDAGPDDDEDGGDPMDDAWEQGGVGPTPRRPHRRRQRNLDVDLSTLDGPPTSGAAPDADENSDEESEVLETDGSDSDYQPSETSSFAGSSPEVSFKPRKRASKEAMRKATKEASKAKGTSQFQAKWYTTTYINHKGYPEQVRVFSIVPPIWEHRIPHGYVEERRLKAEWYSGHYADIDSQPCSIFVFAKEELYWKLESDPPSPLPSPENISEEFKIIGAANRQASGQPSKKRQRFGQDVPSPTPRPKKKKPFGYAKPNIDEYRLAKLEEMRKEYPGMKSAAEIKAEEKRAAQAAQAAFMSKFMEPKPFDKFVEPEEIEKVESSEGEGSVKEISSEEVEDEEVEDGESSDVEMPDAESSDGEVPDEGGSEEYSTNEELPDEESSKEESSIDGVPHEESSEEESSDEEVPDAFEVSSEESSDGDSSDEERRRRQRIRRSNNPPSDPDFDPPSDPDSDSEFDSGSDGEVPEEDSDDEVSDEEVSDGDVSASEVSEEQTLDDDLEQIVKSYVEDFLPKVYPGKKIRVLDPEALNVEASDDDDDDDDPVQIVKSRVEKAIGRTQGRR